MRAYNVNICTNTPSQCALSDRRNVVVKYEKSKIMSEDVIVGWVWWLLKKLKLKNKN